jgi:hypothetical protein
MVEQCQLLILNWLANSFNEVVADRELEVSKFYHTSNSNCGNTLTVISLAREGEPPEKTNVLRKSRNSVQ